MTIWILNWKKTPDTVEKMLEHLIVWEFFELVIKLFRKKYVILTYLLSTCDALNILLLGEVSEINKSISLYQGCVIIGSSLKSLTSVSIV